MKLGSLYNWLFGHNSTGSNTPKHMPKSSVQRSSLELEKLVIPIRIHREARMTARASLGKDTAILRLPHRLPESEEQRLWRWFEDWLKTQINTNPKVAERFQPTLYTDGSTLTVGQKTYRILIENHSGSGHTGRIKGDALHLRLSNHEQGLELHRSVRTLLSRLVAHDQKPRIVERVDQLNAQFFQQQIRGVRLKYNHSNWGSCSRSGNINLSTRLLFAPPEVQDYVIIHELAHLIEFNHSSRYWALVAKADPEYKNRMEWLNTHGHSCNF